MKYIVDYYINKKYTYSNYFDSKASATTGAAKHVTKDDSNGARVLTYNERGGLIVLWEGGDL